MERVPSGKETVGEISFWGTVTLASFALGTLMLPWDVSVSQWCELGLLPRDVRKLFDLAEVFAHGIGIAVIALAVLALDPQGGQRFGWVLVGGWGAGMAANLFKFVIGRTRPKAFLAGFDSGMSESTFTDWLPWSMGAHDLQSFPSGHAAAAAGLAVVLSALYPRGRSYFLALMLLAGVQRVQSLSHYPSDVLFAIALGTVVGLGTTRWMRRRWPPAR